MSNLTMTQEKCNSIINETEKLAIKATVIFSDFLHEYSRWSLENAISSRAELSAEKAANQWLRSFLCNGLLEDEKGITNALKKIKAHGNTGKRNAAKNSTQDATLCFRLSNEQKAAYIKAANGQKLKDWVLSTLDNASK